MEQWRVYTNVSIANECEKSAKFSASRNERGKWTICSVVSTTAHAADGRFRSRKRPRLRSRRDTTTDTEYLCCNQNQFFEEELAYSLPISMRRKCIIWSDTPGTTSALYYYFGNYQVNYKPLTITVRVQNILLDQYNLL
jgi:hypothetical protein